MRIIFVRHGHPNYELDCLTPLGHLLNLPFPFVCNTFVPDYTAITILNFPSNVSALVAPSIEIANDSRHIRNITTENVIGY